MSLFKKKAREDQRASEWLLLLVEGMSARLGDIRYARTAPFRDQFSYGGFTILRERILGGGVFFEVINLADGGNIMPLTKADLSLLRQALVFQLDFPILGLPIKTEGRTPVSFGGGDTFFKTEDTK